MAKQWNIRISVPMSYIWLVIDIILTRCFRTIAIHLRNFLNTLEGDFKIQKENKKLYLGDSHMVNFLTRKPPVLAPEWRKLKNGNVNNMFQI